MTEPTEPTAAALPTKAQLEHARQAGDMMRDIAQLLKDCVFPGALAMRVAGSIQWLERSAAAMPSEVDAAKFDKAEAKRERKALKRKLTVAKPAAADVKTEPTNG